MQPSQLWFWRNSDEIWNSGGNLRWTQDNKTEAISFCERNRAIREKGESFKWASDVLSRLLRRQNVWFFGINFSLVEDKTANERSLSFNKRNEDTLWDTLTDVRRRKCLSFVTFWVKLQDLAFKVWCNAVIA